MHVGYELAIIISYPTSVSEIIIISLIYLLLNNYCFIKNPHKILRILPTLFVKTTDFQLVLRRCIQSGHLLGCNKNSKIVRYFQGRLCDKIGLLCDELCGFFRPILHCFTRFQRRKTTVILFNMQFECKGIIKHLFSNKIVELV